MKRGTPDLTSTTPTATNEDGTSINDMFSNEVLKEFLSYVPVYRYLGSQTISTVCWQWRNLLRAFNFFDKKSYPQIKEACLKDPTLVIYLLSDDSIRRHVSWDQFLEINSCNQELVQYILNTPELCAKLNSFNLATLGQHHLVIAQQILDTPELRSKLNENDLLNLNGKCGFVSGICEYVKTLNAPCEVDEPTGEPPTKRQRI